MDNHNKEQIAVIFDFDGTLANTYDLVVRAVNTFSRAYGFEPLSPHKLEYLRGLPAHQVVKVLGVSWYKLPDLIIKLRQYMKAHIHEVTIYPHMTETIHALKKQELLLGIITSNSYENVTLCLKSNHCHVFDFIDSSRHLFGKAKVLKKIMRQRQLNKTAVYYVGDEVRDIEAAKRCGVHSVAVTWGFNKKDILIANQPSIIIDEVIALKDLLFS